MSEAKEWKINSTLGEWETVSREINSILFEKGFDDDFVISVMLAADEIFANISMYAYGGDVGKAEVSLIINGGVCRLVFKDRGIKFDPTAAATGTRIKKSANLRMSGIGGFGISIAKRQTDDMQYRYSDGQNILILEKRTKIY